MLRVVALCEDGVKALALWRRLHALDGVELHLAVANNAPQSRRRFLLTRLVELARLPGGDRRLALSLLRTRRVRLFLRPLDHAGSLRRLRRLAPDVGLHATSLIYRRPLLEAFRLGVLNPHIGLLPRYRGRSVMEWSLLHGDATGITTFFVDEGIDTGPRVVLRRELPVDGHRDVASAKAFLFAQDGEMFAAALEHLVRGEPPATQPAEGTRWYVMSGLLSGVVDEILRG